MNVLRLMEAAPVKVVLLGVQPESTGWGTALTPVVEAAKSQLVDAALKQIEHWVEEVSDFTPFRLSIRFRGRARFKTNLRSRAR